MRVIRTLIVSVLLGAAAADPVVAQTLTRGPLIQNPAALTTTMTILWWTDVAGDSTVEYGTTPALGSSADVGQAASCEIGAAGTCHTVPLTGLLPNTRYYYRLLTNGAQVLATTYFRTFQVPSDTSELYFTVLGDWGQGTSAQGQIGNNLNADDPPLLFTVGDNAYTNGTQSDWDNNVFIPQFKNGILRRAVFVPALGNHDLNNVGASNWASSVEIKMHALPRNAPAGQEERYFSFDDGNAHFVVLDSNPPGVNATQTAWLASDLASTTRKWKFVFLHHTPYSCATGFASIGSDHNVRATWGPIFEQYGVDIVFLGHDHSYERSQAVDDYVVGGGSGADGKRTYYVMTGGGGAALDGACSVDDGGPYGVGLTHAKEYCPWLATDCSNGVDSQYCSFSRYQHAEVRIANDAVLTLKAIDNNDAVFDTFAIDKTSLCGNGAVESGEQCDQGAANGTSLSCCGPSCQFVAVGATCRAVAGPCDVAETCSGASGACPADGVASAATVCRASPGGCDPAEFCTGASTACPSDTIAGAGAVCRASAGACDPEEACDGVSSACPADAKSTAPCRNASDLCDAVESCDGVSNGCPPDALAPGGVPCRVAIDGCDVTESCTGASASCPPDGFAAAGVVCRPVVGVCDVAETCSGVGPSCPADGFAADTVTCRPAASICDAAERCTGVGAPCPADGFAPASTVCRPAASVCDATEHCTGASSACPADAFASASTVCRPAASACDAAERCTGAAVACPADAVASSSTVCRPASGVCDVAEECDGATTTCPPNGFAASSTVCRPASGVCDLAERCTGSSAVCPGDGFAGNAVACRVAVGVCDAVETCSGTSASCPADGYLPPTVECRPAAGACDASEQCTGAGADCPGDTGQPDGDEDGVCDMEDLCPGEADPSQADTDGDGLGDACDPCTNGDAILAVKAKLTMQRLALPLGDDRFKLSGTMTMPSGAIDPSLDGLRVLIVDANGQTIVDATVPPGAYSAAAASGWRANGPRTTFAYKNKGGTIPSLAGIDKVVLKRSLKVPGQVRFNLSAVGGSFPLPGLLPLTATVIFDPPYASTNQCGDAVFPGPGRPACAFTAPVGTIKCK
ncbi:MAG: metallophosphoesterase [Deltaproteobacteria bacterium]|nr:metallophosphoesterase [Deltaproteobacteria bacterium]